jgi:type IV pilus assembly protein PilN
MIRINLIAPEKPTQKKKAAAGAPGAFGFYLMLGFFVLAGAGLDVGAYVWKSAQIASLDKKIADAQKRQKELQAIKAQVDDLEAKRKTHQMKVDLIERLRREQSDPVHMLDEISKALPDLVWLKKFDQTGTSVTISGMSNGLTAVADFMSALQRCNWFPQVEMGQVKETSTTPGSTGGLLEFNLKATFRNPETARREAEAAAAAAAAPKPEKPAGPAKPAPKAG